MDLLTRIHRKYFYPGSGFEDEDPCSCTYLWRAMDFEDNGESEAAEELLAAAVADETVCGLASCPHCGPETAQYWVDHWAKEGAARSPANP